MHRLSNLARIIGLLSLVVALSGCSAIKLGYNTLPQVTAWWLDRYVDLGDGQEQRVREDIARLHHWHRTQEIPRVVDLLRRIAQLAPVDMSASQACAFVPEIRQRLAAVADRAEPAAVTLALDLELAQLVHLERKYASNNRDYRKEWVELAPAEQKEKRYEQFLDRIEMIYGRLEAEQRDALRREVDRSVFDPALNLAERQRRQKDILQALRQLAGQPVSLSEARAVVHRLIAQGLQSGDLRYRAYQDALVQEACRIFSVVHNSTTPQQRQNAVRRIRAYERDLEEVAAQK